MYSTPPTKNLLKTTYMVKHGFNSCDKGLTQEKAEYHVEHNTTTDQPT